MVSSSPTQTRWFATTWRDTAKTLAAAETLKHTTVAISDKKTNTCKDYLLTMWPQHITSLIPLAGQMPPSSSRASSLHSAFTTSADDMDINHLAKNKCTTPEATQLSQKKTKQDENSPRSIQKNKQALSISLFKDPSEVEFWLGFQAMEQIVLSKGREPIAINIPLEDLILMGHTPGEAQEILTAKTSFPRDIQKLWPTQRLDNVEGQHVTLMQLPFDIDTNQETGLSLDYHIVIHFEKPTMHFNQDQILKNVLLRLKEMNIDIGDGIGKPIAVLCYTSTKAWSGMVKLHLKNPEKDGIAMLRGTRIFALQLDDDMLTIAKIAKGYDVLANSSLTSVRIDSDNIKTLEAHDLFHNIV